jgi:FkbM family methyltransferase
MREPLRRVRRLLRRQAGGRQALARLTKPPAPNDAAARRMFFNRAGPFTPYVSVEVKELTFFVSTNDRLGRGLFARRWRQDLGHLRRAVSLLEEHGLYRAGSTFVDVGASIGTTTVSAIRRHGFARGVALEPEPGNFRTLRLNLFANEIEGVAAFQVAVADREGDVDLALSARSSGTHTLVPLLPDGKSDGTMTVPVVTLDGLVQRGVIQPDAIGLLWIDTAGAEGLVLAGASALLKRGVPIVTAVRPALPSWPGTRESLIGFLSGYTHVADLRRGKEGPSTDLEALLSSLTENADLLVFRR